MSPAPMLSMEVTAITNPYLKKKYDIRTKCVVNFFAFGSLFYNQYPFLSFNPIQAETNYKKCSVSFMCKFRTSLCHSLVHK
jgi:hypothetical protein